MKNERSTCGTAAANPTLPLNPLPNLIPTPNLALLFRQLAAHLRTLL
jgi:hypothetical protein